MTDIDHAGLAVSAWTCKIEGGKREFAEHAALSGLPAAQIAERIRQAGGDCSNSQAEKYINAFRLERQIETAIEDGLTWQAWNMLSPTHWIRIAEKQSAYDIPVEECWEHISIALITGVSSRAFSAHLDEVYNQTPKWKRDLLSAVDILKRFDKQDYVSEIPSAVRNRLRVIFERTARLIERLLKQELDK